MNKKLLSLYGLKWNPFTPDVPVEGLLATPKIESFCWRIENGHLREGGFALVSGDPGVGKSVTLRLVMARLERLRDVTVGPLVHPQCTLGDFYRELGDLFGVELKPSNRWGGFKALRERWQAHIESTLTRPVLLVDEAQEMSAVVLNELRLLSSMSFDSRVLLSVVLAGDRRLTEKLRHEDLLALGSRIRSRVVHEPATRDELMACLKHLVSAAGNSKLMTADLMAALCDHALGNYRMLTTMAAELLDAAAQRELTQLDEKLYFDVFQQTTGGQAKAATPAKTAASGRHGKRR
jgi:type II secretory pathway predicted ATPase ExeA